MSHQILFSLIAAGVLGLSTVAKAKIHLAEGIESISSYQADLNANLAGGKKIRGGVLGALKLGLKFDGEKLFDWSDSRFTISLLGTHGDDPTEYVGDLQGTSNLEATNAVKLFDLWFQKGVHENDFLFRVGFFETETFFFDVPSSSLFLNSSFGLGPEFASGNSKTSQAPSTYPTTSFGVATRTQIDESFDFRFGLFDAVPGNDSDPDGAHLNLDKDDGALLFFEFDYISQPEEVLRPGRAGLGFWTITAPMEKIRQTPGTSSTAKHTGLYMFAEQELWKDDLTGFIRYSLANSKISRVASNFSAGLLFQRIFTWAQKDAIGLAFARAKNSSAYEEEIRSQNKDVDRTETVIELTYNAEFSWGRLQPDYQYVFNPGTDPEIEDASVFNLRFEIPF